MLRPGERLAPDVDRDLSESAEKRPLGFDSEIGEGGFGDRKASERQRVRDLFSAEDGFWCEVFQRNNLHDITVIGVVIPLYYPNTIWGCDQVPG